MRWVSCLGLVLAGACGRFGFEARPNGDDGGDPDAGADAPDALADARPDARPCTTNVHDEDLDGVDDACDVCPHLVDPAQLDGDADGVGDACDPEPALGRQRIVVFDPFTSIDPAWTAISEVVVDGDELLLGTIGQDLGGILSRPLVPTHDLFIVAGSAGTPGAMGQHLWSIVTAPVGPPGGIYCELYDAGSGTSLFVTTTTDNMTYLHPASAPMPQFANGDGVFSYGLDASTMRCAATWKGVDGVANAARPADIATEMFHIYAENVVVRLRYFIQIRTDE
ncbi:MAG: hypothetical protein H0T79_20550 [Deltaproteobacteria bacterium]|nr:hypothetical protein [Deltaproteobacteria bacterium]